MELLRWAAGEWLAAPVRSSEYCKLNPEAKSTIGMPASLAARTSRAAGSETSGVPASETTAIDSPAASRCNSPGTRRASLWAWSEILGVRISKRAQRRAVRRVSSHAISATSRSIRSARSLVSSRFPIGVATT